jgi:hypothetical protein
MRYILVSIACCSDARCCFCKAAARAVVTRCKFTVDAVTTAAATTAGSTTIAAASAILLLLMMCGNDC